MLRIMDGCVVVFFFKQKTAYEMRMSDWSSDVCSSDLISHQESSNEVKVYEVGDDFVLIDTPGLFGFKEQVNAETNAIEKYKDITKKYVSEAQDRKSVV